MGTCPRYFSGFDLLTADHRQLLFQEAFPSHLKATQTIGEPAKRATDSVVICLHGFTGMTFEAMPVAQACAAAGIDALVPLLPGHGYRCLSDQKRHFKRITKAGILNAVREEIARARQHYSFVGLYGQSMGGVIALSLAAEQLVDACAVSAPALKLPWIAEWLAPVICRVPFSRSTCIQNEFYIPSYKFHHSYAVRTLWQLSRHARNQLLNIRCPVLGIHTHQDETVPPVVLEMMEARIPGPVETVWIEPSSHCMTVDQSGAAVSRRVADFFNWQFLGADTH